MMRRTSWLPLVFGLAASLLLAAGVAFGQPVINEILLRPPTGISDKVYQYVEIRDVANRQLPNGTYLVSVEGDGGNNPGNIQNLFDLSGQRIGGNGFLILLQKSNTYSVVTGARALVQSGPEDGFGSGGGSSIGHKGENDRTDLGGASTTFFLIQTTNRPAIGDDLDANNDGVVDAAWFGSWNVWDSIGILDNTGAGDFAYGAINFRRNSASGAAGQIITIDFTPDYIARLSNSVTATTNDWAAGANLGGATPNWILDATRTYPASLAGATLNHIGGPNFGAPALPGIVVSPAPLLAEGGASADYALSLNTAPTGVVTILITADALTEISSDGGQTFGVSRTIILSNATPATVKVRAVDNHWIEGLPHHALVSHQIIATADTAHYSTNSPPAALELAITDNDTALLSELKVNPPGPDNPCEFIELAGPAGGRITNVYLVAIAGDPKDNPGTVSWVQDLSGAAFGTNGTLLIAASNHPYVLPPGTGFFPAPDFGLPGGAMENDSATFLLLASSMPPELDADWDRGDNGILEGLPEGSLTLDSVALMGASTYNLAYSPATFSLWQGIPEAATRFPGNTSPNSSNAWFFGKLAGTNGTSLAYDNLAASPNFPLGTLLSPGSPNRISLSFGPIRPICGTIGDATNPTIMIQVANADTNANAAILWAESDNPAVVVNSNLVPTLVSPGTWSLRIEPTGVGYATITIFAQAGTDRAQITLPYAASAMGRPGGHFHSGASDASTAIALDADWMLVGDDENQVLRLFNRHNSGPAVWQTNMTPFLQLTDLYPSGQPREVDIEASTRVGNRVFWVGAHSHAIMAEARTNRSRLFATELSGSGTNISLTYLGRYDYLKLDLVTWDASNGHGKGANYYGLFASTEEGIDPKSPEGLNIEGLVMAPGSTSTAYVCFRAPIVPPTNRCSALIVPVVNFYSLAASDGPPGSAVFGQPIELDLFGRGIRSIEGDTNGYLIVAGTPLYFPGGYPNDFKLYTWSGSPADTPVEQDTDLSGMVPEGIVELPPAPWVYNSPVQLISDNGIKDWYGDGIQAKFLPVPEFKKFRSDMVTLGRVVAARPIIQSIQQNNAEVVIRWRATVGTTYRLEYKTNLPEAVWTSVPGDLTASATQAGKTNFFGGGQRFYRVIVP